MVYLDKSLNYFRFIILTGDSKELTIKGGHLGPYMWPKAISMIANGDLPMDKIISHVFPLKDFKKGIETVYPRLRWIHHINKFLFQVLSGKENIKVMLIPENM